MVEQDLCSWESYVPLSLLDYRSIVHSLNLKSPFKMIYGRKAVLPGFLELSFLMASINPESNMKILNNHLFTLPKEAYL